MNDRRQTLLNRAVSFYIQTAEPVASNTLKQQFGMDVSSATVRAELNALEKDGYLAQPHTSSGRVPTSKGYRYYVDHLLSGASYGVVPIETYFDMDAMVGFAVEQISSMGYVSMYSPLSVQDDPIHHVRFVRLDDTQYVFIMVFQHGRVFEHRFRLALDVDCELVSSMLTHQLAGVSVYDVEGEALSSILYRFPQLNRVLSALFAGIQAAQLDFTHHAMANVFGVSTLFSHPEFQDLGKSKRVISVLDDRRALTQFLGRISSGGHSRVVIGQENDIENLQDCSIVVTPFMKGRRPVGVLGSLGPTRMMYSTIVPFLSSVKRKIESLFSA